MAMTTVMNPHYLSHNSIIDIGHKDRTEVDRAKVGNRGEDAGMHQTSEASFLPRCQRYYFISLLISESLLLHGHIQLLHRTFYLRAPVQHHFISHFSLESLLLHGHIQLL